MNYTIESIEESLRTGQNSPHDLANMRGFLASAYSYHTGLLQDILEKKATIWNQLRTSQKSDTATDRLWDATDEGMKETQNRLFLKRIEKLMSGLKSLLQLAEGEARNQF